MKKFWNLMLAVLVMLGAAACTETDESVDAGQKAGVSFYATFGDDDTRAYIDDADGDRKWTTIWESGDTLSVTNTADNSSYTFVCTDAATGKFTCEDSAAANLVGKSVSISSDSDIHLRDSRLGKKALYVLTTGVTFTQDATIQLTSQTSFLRYTYEGEGDVTLKLELQTSDGSEVYAFIDNNVETKETNEITFSGIKGENFVPFWCGVNSTEVERNATLSYSIDGVKVKEATINRIGCGKVYNLGTLTEPETLAKVYLVPNDGWKADGAWFSAHFFNSTDGFADVKMTDDNADGIYECSVPADMENVLFCRMNPAFTEFAWNEEGATDENLHVWNQTADEVIGVEPDNYYYILDWTEGIWGDKDGYELPVRTLGIIGLGGNWDVDKDMTLEGDYYTLKGVAVTATDSFKVRANDAWAENYGLASSATVDAIAIEKDTMYSLVQDGKNMQLVAGTYDFYFNDTTKEFYAMTPGTTPDDLSIAQYKIYVHPYNCVWTKFNLYSWDTADANPTGGWPGATTTVTETINGYTYYVWTMPRSATGASLSIILNDGSAQTADFTLGTLDKDYYLLLNGVVLSFVEDKENPEPEVVQGEPQPSTWALAGDFNSWGDMVMYTTDVAELFVAKSVTIGAYKEIKVKQVGNWNNSYGGGINYLNANIWTTAHSGGSNFSIINAGVY
ncbi:MAG: starch-binding protein, partial [Alistipes sp.]|nr:starch-binding protein [Alistipes sp.]